MPTGSIARQSRAAGWWVGALTVAVAVMATTFGSPPAISEIGPTSYLPPDGFRVRFTGGSGALATEWAVDQASGLINAGPAHFMYWLGASGLDISDTVTARQSTVFTNAAGVVVNREDTFMVAGDEGIGTGVEVRTWTDSRFYFPARLDLPTDLAAGKSWTSQGKAKVFTQSGDAQDTTYRATYQATAATTRDEQVRRCVHITMNLTVGTVTDSAVTRTWCPKLGVITLAETDATWQAAAANATIEPPVEKYFDWSLLDQLTFAPHTINDATVQGAILATPLTAPAVLSDGTIVVVQKQFHDSVGLTTEAEPIHSVWRARPGGRAITTATFGDLTVITTSNRQLVAYDKFGRWVWQAQLPDQAVVAPVRLADLAVIATLDGSVTAVRLTNGEVAWTKRVGDAVRLRPQASADRVIVADLSQAVTCFGADGTQLWSQDSLSVNNLAISSGDDPVVVLGVPGRRGIGLDLADGTQRWSVPQPVSFVDMFALDQVMVVRDGNLTVGLDPHTGATTWAWDKARTYAGAGKGTHLLLLTDNKLVALDSHGSQVKEWPVALGNLGASSVSISFGTDRVLLWQQRSVLLGVAK